MVWSNNPNIALHSITLILPSWWISAWKAPVKRDNNSRSLSQMLIVTGGWDAFYQATASTEVATTFIIISSLLSWHLSLPTLLSPCLKRQAFDNQVFNYSEGGEWRSVAFSHNILNSKKLLLQHICCFLETNIHIMCVTIFARSTPFRLVGMGCEGLPLPTSSTSLVLTIMIILIILIIMEWYDHYANDHHDCDEHGGHDNE